MIGPSAPNGAPVPMAIAAEIGLAIAVRGATRLCLVSTASIASGMPWPRITGAHLARRLISRAPATAATNSGQPGSQRRRAAAAWWRVRGTATALVITRDQVDEYPGGEPAGDPQQSGECREQHETFEGVRTIIEWL